jgi:N-acetylneuraminic acid mutarotase
MIVWGGRDAVSYFDTGGRYTPGTDSWTTTSTINAPDGRYAHTAVWTGTEMIVWGGFSFVLGSLNTGGRYDPGTDSWTATSTINAPDGRLVHTAVWTGSEMIVWGGSDNISSFDTGGRYTPGTDSWTATSTANAPDGRFAHTAVWTGTEMIVWGGSNISGDYFHTGGRYNPGLDSWAATSANNTPSARGYHTAVWTGSEMIVWGGADGNNFLDTGGRYNPGTDSWTATSTANAPSAREVHTAVWTGSEMIVWGGFNNSDLNTGRRYNPGTDSWTATSTTNAPDGRFAHTAVWTGSEMIVWGGFNNVSYFNTGGRYCVQSPCANYVTTPGTDTIVPGTTDIGNHTDDGDTFVALPFSFQLYNRTHNSVNVSSNGRLDLLIANDPGGFQTACLPAPPGPAGPYDFTIFPLWNDLRTDVGLPGCQTWASGCGIFTSVSGSTPNRIFNIEWRAVLFADVSATQNFEVRLYENPALNQRFDVIIGALNSANTAHPWVSGVQGPDPFFTQDFCIDPPSSPPQNVSRTYTMAPCATPTPTPTSTPTPASTPTPTATPRPHPTPRLRPTPRPRPTPLPRP